MADEFIMPKLGLTMEYGKVSEWLVANGAEVTAGQAVLMVETDKVETEVEASGGGRLHHVAEVGEEYACGATVGWFLAEGEAAPVPVSAVAPGAAAVGTAPIATTPVTATMATSAPIPPARSGRLFVSPNARRLAAEANIDLRTVAGTGPNGRIVSEDLAGHQSNGSSAVAPAAQPLRTVAWGGPSSGGSVPATAAARQLADLLGVDLREVAAGASTSRLTREDVAEHVRSLLAARAAPAPTRTASQPPSSVLPFTGMRGAIADRMAASLREAAQLTLTMDVDMDGVVTDRNRRKAEAAGAVPGFTDYVIAATAEALGAHPHLNSEVTADGVALLPEVHIGMAVALDDGLIVPVIRNTAALSLEDLASETTRLAAGARDRKLGLDEIQGGTFSVTALGMFGVDAFTPIINPPNTAILGIGRIRRDAAWSATDELEPVSRLTLSLTWDHRAVDGAPAAQFVADIKRRLEDV